MKLYYTKGACSLAVRIAINEINIPCEYEAVNLQAKQTETGADYFKINPKGAVPALKLDNGEVLTENSIIQQYLADEYKAHKLLPPVGDFKRYRVLEWLNFITTDLHKGFSPLFNPKVPQEIKDSIFKVILADKFKLIDQHLQNHPYLFEQYTLPDGYLFVMLLWANSMGINLEKCTNLMRYFEELKKRPAIARSLKEEGL